MTTKDYDIVTIKVMNELFKELVAINPAFKQAWPTEQEFMNTKRQWILAFKEPGIRSLEQIKKGLKAMRQRSDRFIPSPGEFINLCKLTPDDIDAPQVRDAYIEAVNKSSSGCGSAKEWSHPAVKLARNSITSFELSHRPENEMFPRFKEIYLGTCEKYTPDMDLDLIEETKQNNFTKRDMHWILLYEEHKKIGSHLGWKELFPSEGLFLAAEELYNMRVKNQGR